MTFLLHLPAVLQASASMDMHSEQMTSMSCCCVSGMHKLCLISSAGSRVIVWTLILPQSTLRIRV